MSVNQDLVYFRFLTLDDKNKLIASAKKTIVQCNSDAEISLFHTQAAIAIAAVVK